MHVKQIIKYVYIVPKMLCISKCIIAFLIKVMQKLLCSSINNTNYYFDFSFD